MKKILTRILKSKVGQLVIKELLEEVVRMVLQELSRKGIPPDSQTGTTISNIPNIAIELLSKVK